MTPEQFISLWKDNTLTERGGENIMSAPKTLQIRNSTAEFLVFTKQAGENSIEVRVEDETVWLTQKLVAPNGNKS